jgi:hypothetical protein
MAMMMVTLRLEVMNLKMTMSPQLESKYISYKYTNALFNNVFSRNDLSYGDNHFTLSPPLSTAALSLPSPSPPLRSPTPPPRRARKTRKIIRK